MSGRDVLSKIRSVRIARFLLHLLRGVFTVAFAFPFFSASRRRVAVKRWSQTLLRILGVRVHVHGEPPRRTPGRAVMLVANHVSWLDIVVINAVLPVRFVAKSEVRAWPVIGWLSAKTGTLFIERARRRDTARITRLVSAALHDGDICAIFPEGTTTDGSRVLQFHSSLLQPALVAGADVHPVALRFEHSDGALCTEAAYVDDKTLWDTLRSISGQPQIHAHVWFLDALPGAGARRRALAEAAQGAIARRLAQ
jgi:1-acyl-sn-glycerol-3-phosphate acyltransferase